jgi:hypothetical protein
MKCVRRALRSDGEAISFLRLTEFKASRHFAVLEEEKLIWNEEDEKSIVVAAWDPDGKAVSTMRATKVRNREEAENWLHCSAANEMTYPALVFSNAATRGDHRNMALNQLIRHHLLSAALRSGIKTQVSPVFDGAPRIEFMKVLGYKFVVPASNWQTKLDYRGKQRILGIIDHSKMESALATLKRMRADILDMYPWHGVPIDFIS